MEVTLQVEAPKPAVQGFVREAAVERFGVVCADDAVDVYGGCCGGGRGVAVYDCYEGGLGGGGEGEVIGCGGAEGAGAED